MNRMRVEAHRLGISEDKLRELTLLARIPVLTLGPATRLYDPVVTDEALARYSQEHGPEHVQVSSAKGRKGKQVSKGSGR